MPKFMLRDEGGQETIEADDMAAALEAARDWLRNGYDAEERTIWVDAYVWPLDDDGVVADERDSVTVQIDPDEPRCGSGNHDWQSPIELVGGIAENPGVWGHGGGCYINEVCMCCGTKRVTDTWAQRPDTGEQGLTSVSYERNAFASEVAEREAEAA